MIVIADTTPLINFSIIRELRILKALFAKVIIPEAVFKEIIVEGASYPSAAEVQKALDEGWVERKEPKRIELVKLLLANLDEGEAEAIALGVELKASYVLIDETEARKAAQLMGLNCLGSIGCLLAGKGKGIIAAIKPYLDRMRSEARYWVSEELYKAALEQACES
jgi:hypothetical protein